MYIYLILSVLTTVSAVEVVFLNPINLWYVGFSTPDCVSWMEPPKVPKQACIKLSTAEAVFVIGKTNTKYYKPTTAVAYVLVGMLVEKPSYVFTGANFQGTFEEAPGLLCNTNSTQLSGKPPRGYTKADCCVDPQLPSCLAFSSRNYASVLNTAFYCITSYEGLSLPYGTPCESFYETQSPYYISSPPENGTQLLHNYGQLINNPKHGCYIENWANYRPVPHKFSFSDPLIFSKCDYVMYAFQVLADRKGLFTFSELREDHDDKVLTALGNMIPTYLTIGGWTANNTILDYAFCNNSKDTRATLLAWVQKYKLAGIDIDFEWPGKANGGSTSDPAYLPCFVEFMKLLCADLHLLNKECALGVLTVGTPFNSFILQELGTLVDKYMLFGYDLHGFWDGYVAPQNVLQDLPSTSTYGLTAGYSIMSMINNILRYVPASKVMLGMPVYTRGFIITNGQADKAYPLKGVLLDVSESGADVMVYDTNGVEMPAGCVGYKQLPMQNAPGFYQCVGIDSGGNNFSIPYSNLTTFSLIINTVKAKGVNNFYLYAFSMNANVSAKYMDLFHAATAKARPKRSAMVYYGYPANVPSATYCPDIVYYTNTLIVTAAIYDGCGALPDTPEYCYFATEKFTCKITTQKPKNLAVMDIKRESECMFSLDIATLYVATVQSVKMVCLHPTGLFLMVRAVTICGNVLTEIKPSVAYVLTTNLNVSYLSQRVATYDSPTVEYSFIAIPRLCMNITQAKTCVAAVCGSSAACVSSLAQSPLKGTCEALAYLQSAYEDAVNVLQQAQNNLQRLIDRVLRDAGSITSVFEPIETPSARRKRFLPLLFGAIGMLFGIGSMVQNADLSSKVSGLTSSVTALNTHVKAIESSVNVLENKYNALVDTTAKGFLAQDKINQKVAQQFDAVQQSFNQLTAAVDVKFANVDKAMAVLSGQMNDIAQALNAFSATSANVQSYAASLSFAVATAQTLTSRVQLTTNVLILCAASLQRGSIDGCVDDIGLITPLKINVISDSKGVQNIVFVYLKQLPASFVTVTRGPTFCYRNMLYIAPAGCYFVFGQNKVDVLTDTLAECIQPVQQFVYDCERNNTYVLRLNASSPAVLFTFTADQFTKPIAPVVVVPTQPPFQSFNMSLEKVVSNLSDIIAELQRSKVNVTLFSLLPALTDPVASVPIWAWLAISGLVILTIGVVIFVICLSVKHKQA